MHNIGERIKTIRKNKKIMIRELSIKTNISENEIINIEKGCIKNPRISTLIKIADGLEISLKEILD